jgi:hypothetical protein
MKNKISLITLIGITFISLQVQAAGSISGPGWYYQRLAVGAVGTYENIFLQGAYASSTECDTARSNDYDPSDGFKPWDGGPGCHYIYANEVDLANELYSIAFDTGTIIGLAEEQLHEFFQQLNDINQAHDIEIYKVKVNRLVDSYSRNR